MPKIQLLIKQNYGLKQLLLLHTAHSSMPWVSFSFLQALPP